MILKLIKRMFINHNTNKKKTRLLKVKQQIINHSIKVNMMKKMINMGGIMVTKDNKIINY